MNYYSINFEMIVISIIILYDRLYNLLLSINQNFLKYIKYKYNNFFFFLCYT